MRSTSATRTSRTTTNVKFGNSAQGGPARCCRRRGGTHSEEKLWPNGNEDGDMDKKDVGVEEKGSFIATSEG